MGERGVGRNGIGRKGRGATLRRTKEAMSLDPYAGFQEWSILASKKELARSLPVCAMKSTWAGSHVSRVHERTCENQLH